MQLRVVVLDVEAWNGRCGADIYELRAGITCWRDFPISDFSLQNCIGCNIEGLVIFGI